jgi:CrcB protein
MNYVCVIVGGGIGALLRYLSSRGIGALVKTPFPAATLVVNAAGAFIIGFLFGLFESRAVPQGVRLLLITGFLGGFTTFSSYSLETARLFADGRFAPALINIGLHNLLCLGLTLLGLGISRGFKA